MSRELPTGLATALNLTEVPAVILVELAWPDGTVYIWNGYAPLSWNGHTWTGVGYLGQISEVSESSDLSANGLTLSLSGIPSAYITEILRNDVQGRSARVFFGPINGDAFSIDPVCIFDGIIDVTSFVSDGKTATISIGLEKEFIDNRSSAARYTPEDQKQLYPTDLGLDMVPGLADKTFSWGKDIILPAPTQGGGGGGDGSGNGEAD